jgi:hypothetical protein
MLVLVPLGMLQKQHPDIALSIKTRQAIRSVKNNGTQCLWYFSKNNHHC